MRIGITGHTNLTTTTSVLVRGALDAELAGCGGGLIGVSCLARGADQIFAWAVLDAGGSLEVVLPAADYRARKVQPDNAAEFEELLGKAADVHTLPFAESNPGAYMAAGEHVLSSVDRMVAVWDGRPAGGHGGTGDVVHAARGRGLPLTVVWPENAARA